MTVNKINTNLGRETMRSPPGNYGDCVGLFYLGGGQSSVKHFNTNQQDVYVKISYHH